MPERLATRLHHLARAYELHYLANLDLYGPVELGKPQAQGLSAELEFLANLVDDPLLLPHMTGIRNVCDYCWQFPGESWIVVEGP